MKKNYLFAATLVAAVMTGCSQDEHLSFTDESKSTFTGVMESVGSRTVLNDENTVEWDPNDQVTIFEKNNYNSLYKIVSLENGVANFKFDSYTSNGTYTEMDAYYAVYPYSVDNSINVTDGTISAPISDEYTFTDKESSIASALMVAKSDDTSLNFTNAQGIIRFRLNAKIPEQYGAIQSIKLTSEKHKLSGTATMSWEGTTTPKAVIVDDDKAGQELILNLADELKVNLPKLQDN